jgi:hypothetical protein
LSPARPLAVLAALAAAGLPIAGCGTGEKDFISGYNDAAKALQSITARLGRDLNNAPKNTDEQIEAQFLSLSEKTGHVSDDLAALTPPKDVKPEVAKLRVAVKRYRRDLALAAKELKASEIEKTRAAVTSLGPDAEAIRLADAAVKRQLEN